MKITKEHLFILSLISYLFLALLGFNTAIYVKKTLLRLLYIIPFLALAQLIVFVLDRFQRKIKEILAKKYSSVFFIIFGVLSSGPIYMWYDILSGMEKKFGIRYKHILLFLYNRGVKLQLIPLLASILGLKIAIYVNLIIILLSVPYAYILDKLLSRRARVA